jgi:hypothetical protein
MTKPSWQNFATHDESAYPELWDGVIGAWAPFLGPTGSRQHDLSRLMNWQSAASVPVYSLRQGVIAVTGNSGLSATTPASYLGLTEATMFAWVSKTTQIDIVACGALTGANNSRFSFAWFSDGNLYASIEQSGSNFATRVLTGSGARLIGLQFRGTAGNTVSGVWVDGVRTTGPAAPASLRTTTSASSLTTDGFSNTSANGAVFGMVFWRRCLSDNEMLQISRIGLPALFDRRRRRAIYLPQAGFQPAWALRRSQVIGGGLR